MDSQSEKAPIGRARLLGRGRGLNRPVPPSAEAVVRRPIEESPISAPSSVQATTAASVASEESAPGLPTQLRGVGRARRIGSSVASTTSTCNEPTRSFTPQLSMKSGDGQLEGLSSTVSKVSLQETEGACALGAVGNEPAYYRGTSGVKSDFIVNYIPIKLKKGFSVFEYHVAFNPEVESRKFRFKLVGSIVEHIGGTKSFDGAKLYLPNLLPEAVTNFKVVNPVDQTDVQLTLKFVGETKSENSVHHYNLLLRRAMHEIGMIPIGRNFFNPNQGTDVARQQLTIFPGFITSVRDFEGGLMLCAEISHRVLRKITVLQLILEAMRDNRGEFRDVAAKQLIGSVILTRYNNKTYRVDEIEWNQTPLSTFQCGDRQMSYMEYYKSVYNIEIKETNQPLLIHRVKKQRMDLKKEEQRLICTVPELCYLTGLSDDMRKDFVLMKDISAVTRMAPQNRQFELIKFIEQINSNDKAKKFLDGWGIEFLPELVTVPGRMLKEETICFSKKEVSAGKNANWSREVGSSLLLKPVSIINWAIVLVQKDYNKASEFVKMLKYVVQPMGVLVSDPQVVVLRDDSNRELSKRLDLLITPDIQLVVVINPSLREDRYNLIKKICCVERPVPSQVINARTIGDPRKLRSVTQNIALQLNCKLGGELWSLKIPLTGVMVCGIDCYHNTSKDNKSVYGFVSSMNETLTQWFCDTKFQSKGQEIGIHLKHSVVSAILKFQAVNKTFPKKLIFVRDGVSDGQLQQVSEGEINYIKEAFKEFHDYVPQFLFVVVQKRINTKIFAQSFGNYNRRELTNPPPGTIIDQIVTRKHLYDFFLVSQHVTQGTVTPTHYIVMFNNILTNSGIMSPDRVQQIMYKMTHLYYNWPGTIRVPAPCQYAHKLASLVGENLKKEPSASLLDRLFFL